jgi:hypothetical protein
MCYSAGIVSKRVLHLNSVDLPDFLARETLMRDEINYLGRSATNCGGYFA